jgi:hypothetical protein
MLTSKEIREKAERSYKDFLLSVLRREVFFPFHIKGNKGNANLPLQELYPALKHLIDHSKEKIGYGFTLTYKEVNTRHSGIITMPHTIFFENPKDFLQFIEKENDFLSFRKALEHSKRHAPTLLVWLEENVLKFQKNAIIWEDILKIVLYFQQNNQPNCYWRQLPIDVDLAEMEAHQPLIGELLEAVLPPKAIFLEEKEFAPRFGLRYDEPMLRSRWNDEDISLPIANFIKKYSNCTIKNVYFLTEKSIYLSFPSQNDTLLIFWEYPTTLLAKFNFLSEKTCFLTADISPKSFEQLSEMRNYLPKLQSFLMDKNVFDAFPQHHQTVKTANFPTFLPHLTPEEQALYQNVLSLEEKNTLLQRNVSHSFLLKQAMLL